MKLWRLCKWFLQFKVCDSLTYLKAILGISVLAFESSWESIHFTWTNLPILTPLLWKLWPTECRDKGTTHYLSYRKTRTILALSSTRSRWWKLIADPHFFPVLPKFYMVGAKPMMKSLIAQNRGTGGTSFSDKSLPSLVHWSMTFSVVSQTEIWNSKFQRENPIRICRFIVLKL